MDFFGIGPWEVVLILIVALLVVGPEKIPGIARTLGRTVRAIRRASSELTTAVTRELEAAEKAEKKPTAPRTAVESHSSGAGTPGPVDLKENPAPEGHPAEPGGASPTK
jgi:Tat protein translocase TatB subunit